ncbi:uncharacterized protein LOC104451287 [Eucalyptus grandis]|uniref:Uncharacterized protein n=2 Tax=Eucalyptus grandis TaxID=71139 RepID=A0A059BLQ6_EUCGR|nr:uncharacterized protein LOC104451287 [Eucalyptus grandis]KAK3423820.1 hypothetical protein EUGRSUZ_F00586 [Eucalyptus grandis]
MGWLIREKRGPAWKHGWTRQTIDSMSLPPMPVVTLFGIVLLLLWLSFHINYTRQMERTVVSLKLLLLLVPLLLIILARWLDANRGRLVIPLPDADPDTMHRVSRTPWGVALLVGLVLLLLSFQSNLRSQWSPWWSSRYHL